MSLLLLAGDIGGTHTRLCLKQKLEREEDSWITVHEREFDNSNYEGLTPILKDFFEEATKKSKSDSLPQMACFAVAGPVEHKNTCNLTNLGWKLNCNDLEQQLKIGEVILINDFEAVGYGILQLRDTGALEAFEILQSVEEKPKPSVEEKPKPSEDDLIGVIGAGTGLGEAFILKNELEDTWIVYPTEGGHVDFAARNEIEFNLREDIKCKYQISHVSVERVVSGPGIVSIYQFLRGDRPGEGNLRDLDNEVKTWVESGRDLSTAPSEKIDAAALEGDETCKATMQMFREAYSSEVGNFALRLLPYGGLYIAGGIAPKILRTQELKKSFVEELKSKGRMKKVIEKIPIYLVKNDQVGLIGAGYYAKRLSTQKNSSVAVVQ